VNLFRPSNRLIYPLIIVGQLIAGGTFPIAKIAVSSIEPFTLALLRFGIASATMLLIIVATGRVRKIERGDWLRFIMLGLLAVPLNQLLFLYGLKFTTAGRSALYYGATPIFVFLLAILYLKEKITPLKVIGIAASFAGVAVILRGGRMDEGVLFGDFLVILAVIAWAAYTVFGKKLLKKYGALTVTAYALIIGTLAYLPIGIVPAIRFNYSQVPDTAWLSLLYIAIMTSVVAYSIWYWALARMEASKLAIFQNLQPIFAAILSMLFVSESFGFDFYLGGALVIGGVLLTQRG
jgi:drug/metabolite transporter (DMT)-like permease